MRPSIRVGLAILFSGLALPLLAQAPRSGGGGANQQMVQQYQQLAAEKTALETQVAGLKHDLDTSHTELAAAKKERDALKARNAGPSPKDVAELTAAKQEADKNAEQAKQRLNELVSRFRDTANDLKLVETNRDGLKGELSQRSADYDRCAADNLALYEMNGEVLDRYEHVGLFTRVGTKDPFTGITRNRIENLVDRYRTRALELRAKSRSGAGP